MPRNEHFLKRNNKSRSDLFCEILSEQNSGANPRSEYRGWEGGRGREGGVMLDQSIVMICSAMFTLFLSVPRTIVFSYISFPLEIKFPRRVKIEKNL